MKSDSPHARELLKLSADFSTEILKARKEWGDIFIVLKGKKPAKEGHCIWQNCGSEMKAKLRHYQINKSLRELSSSPLDMPYKKCYRVFFKLLKNKRC